MQTCTNVALLAVGPNGEFGTKNPENYGIPFNSRTDMKWFKAMATKTNVITSSDSFKYLPLDKMEDRIIWVEDRNRDVIETHVGKNIKPYDIAKRNVFAGGALFTKMRLDIIDYIFISVVGKLNNDEVTTYLDINELMVKGHKVIWAGQTKEDISKDDSNRLYILSKNSIDDMFKSSPDLFALVSEHFEPYQKLHVKEPLLINKDAHGEAEVKEFIYVPEGYTGVISIRRKLKLYTSGTTLRNRWVGTPQVIVNNRSHQPVELKAGEEIAEIAFVRN